MLLGDGSGVFGQRRCPAHSDVIPNKRAMPRRVEDDAAQHHARNRHAEENDGVALRIAKERFGQDAVDGHDDPGSAWKF